MTAREMIKKFGLTIATRDGQEMLRIYDDSAKDHIAEIKAMKAEIIETIKADEKAAKDAAENRKAKIASIPGLKEIEAAQEDWNRYNVEFNRMMEDENNDGVNPPRRPTTDVKAMMEMYPVAAAYLRAEAEEMKSNYQLAEIGKKAKERIINGEDHTIVMADMETAIKTFANSHIWD